MPINRTVIKVNTFLKIKHKPVIWKRRNNVDDFHGKKVSNCSS